MIREYTLTETEKFCVRGYLTEQTSDNLITAYCLSRLREPSFSSWQSGYNVSLRWLTSKPVQKYILEDLGYDRDKIGSRVIYTPGAIVYQLEQ